MFLRACCLYERQNSAYIDAGRVARESKTMFWNMNGRQAAGWGYGIFWLGLLIETVNTIVSALSGSPLESPAFWIGTALTVFCTAYGITLLASIRHRPW